MALRRSPQERLPVAGRQYPGCSTSTVAGVRRSAPRLRQPPRQLRRCDDDELGRRAGQADVEELVEPLARDGELDEDDDLALHPLEAADRLEEDLVGLVGNVLGR